MTRPISMKRLLNADRQIVKADQLPEWIGQDVDLTGMHVSLALDYLMNNEDFWEAYGVEAGLERLSIELRFGLPR